MEPIITERNPKEEFEVREFIPADSRYPRVYIKIRNNGALDDKKIIVKIDNWGVGSKYPRGHFVSIIGKIGDDYTEGNVILLEHNVEIKNFSRHVMECLPTQGVTIFGFF
jgi:exosome complex exonuclease DIS3/RRP44